MLGIGADSFYRDLAYGSLDRVAKLQTDRDNFNQQAKAAKTNNTLSGAAAGAAIGTVIAPGVGTVAGGVIGGLVGNFI